jgi:hypothetical protein
MKERSAPGLPWFLGVLIVALLVGGITTVITDDGPIRKETVVETEIHDEVVLPEHQAEVSGTIDGFVADDATGAPITMPIDIDKGGGATIEGALVDGERATIVWDGGRPLHLDGSGTVDLGPTHVELGVGAVFWTIDGLRILTPGDYEITTPVAVGTGGLARPRDEISFAADDDTTIETRGGGVVGRGLPVHLEGPGSFRGDGHFRVKTRAGTIEATHLEFGPGSFVIDVADGGTFTAVFNGPLTSK